MSAISLLVMLLAVSVENLPSFEQRNTISQRYNDSQAILANNEHAQHLLSKTEAEQEDIRVELARLLRDFHTGLQALHSAISQRESTSASLDTTKEALSLLSDGENDAVERAREAQQNLADLRQKPLDKEISEQLSRMSDRIEQRIFAISRTQQVRQEAMSQTPVLASLFTQENAPREKKH